MVSQGKEICCIENCKECNTLYRDCYRRDEITHEGTFCYSVLISF